MYRKLLVLMSGVIMATLIVGCNTIKGVGQDIQSGGKAISKTAEKVSEKI